MNDQDWLPRPQANTIVKSLDIVREATRSRVHLLYEDLPNDLVVCEIGQFVEQAYPGWEPEKFWT